MQANRFDTKRRRVIRGDTVYGPFARAMPRGTRRSRKPYSRTGKSNRRQGTLRGQSFRSNAAAPLVHRSVYPNAFNAVWPLLAGPGNHLDPLQVLVPDKTWGRYTRGFDINQVTSSGIRSRNCTMNLEIKFPTAAAG